ncbi:MAG: surfeit locus 1 family protein [Arenicella sp.]|jgi:surfeit locus 1 family protein
MTRLKKPILMLLGLAACLIMIGLGDWQLSRADLKQTILDRVQQRSAIEPVSLASILPQISASGSEQFIRSQTDFKELTFMQVFADGQYAAEQSVFIDNKVVVSRVGYKLLTPFKIEGSAWWVLVDRGWLSVGESRATLPRFATDSEPVRLSGRLTLPPAQPPLWSDRYPVSQGSVWQYLPISDYAQQMKLNLLPLVLELAPTQSSEIDQDLIRQWSAIDDQWVAKHQGYAFQWFAMAFAFFIACSVLVYRSFKPD